MSLVLSQELSHGCSEEADPRLGQLDRGCGGRGYCHKEGALWDSAPASVLTVEGDEEAEGSGNLPSSTVCPEPAVWQAQRGGVRGSSDYSQPRPVPAPWSPLQKGLSYCVPPAGELSSFAGVGSPWGAWRMNPISFSFFLFSPEMLCRDLQPGTLCGGGTLGAREKVQAPLLYAQGLQLPFIPRALCLPGPGRGQTLPRHSGNYAQACRDVFFHQITNCSV